MIAAVVLLVTAGFLLLREGTARAADSSASGRAAGAISQQGPGSKRRMHSRVRPLLAGETFEPTGYPLAHQDMVAAFRSEGEYNLAGLTSWNGRPVTETNKPGKAERRLAAAIRLYVPHDSPNILYVQVNHVVTTEGAYWVGPSFINVTQTGVRMHLQPRFEQTLASPDFSSEFANPEEVLLDGGENSCSKHVYQPLTSTPGYELTALGASDYEIHASQEARYGLSDFYYVCGEPRINGGGVFELVFPQGVDLRNEVDFAASRVEAEYGAGNQLIEAAAIPIPDPTQTTPPTVSCGQPDETWHVQNVLISCTAQDEGGPGLANSEDASFTLATTLPTDSESSTAQTERRWVCDLAENCVSAGPIGPIRVDLKAPTLDATYPSEGELIPEGSSPTAEYACVDGGSGVVGCEAVTSGLETETPGQHTYAVRATDAVGNTATRVIHYTVGPEAECSPLAQLCQSGAGDSLPPQLTGLSATPPSVDTSEEPRTVTFTATITDDISGVAAAQINLQGHGYWLTSSAHLISGSPVSGMWQASITLPQGAPAGSYPISLSTFDEAGNRATYQSPDLAADGFASAVSQSGEGATTENTPPHLVGLTASPTTLSTCDSAESVTVAAHLTSSAGVAAVRAVLTGPAGQHTASRASLESGGILTDGTWTARLPLARYSAQGNWRLSLTVTDNSGAEVPFAPQDLETAGFPATVAQTCPGDTTAPTASAVVIAPEEVDTSASAADVTVDVHAHDDLSGVASLSATLSDGTQHAAAAATLLEGGSSTDDTWRATLHLPRYSAQGTWYLALTMVDNAGNKTTLSPGDLSEAGLANSIDQRGAADETPPEIAGGALSPSAIDTSAGPASVQITVHALDAQSGVSRVVTRLASAHGQQVAATAFEAHDEGSPQDDNWLANLVVPQYSEEGEWYLTVELWDSFGNRRSYGPSELTGLGLFRRFFVGRPPTLAAVTPRFLPTAGKTQIRVTGSELASTESITVAGKAATLTTVSVHEVLAEAPANPAGPATVVLMTPYGQSSASVVYVAPEPSPTIKVVKPKKGPANGGTRITITGTGLDGVERVVVAGAEATNIANVSVTEIDATVPQGVAGVSQVSVTTPYGTSGPGTKTTFTYERPIVTGVLPHGGSVSGGSTITVTGFGFAPGTGTTTFVIGKVQATESQCPTMNACTIRVPAAKRKGTANVVAAVGSAKSKKTPAASYQYE